MLIEENGVIEGTLPEIEAHLAGQHRAKMEQADHGVMAVTSDLQSAGAVVYWRLGGTCDGANLAAAWVAEGLGADLLPEMPTPATALRRAMGEQREKRVLVRPLDGEKGWALVTEKAVGEGLEHAVSLTVHLGVAGDPGAITFASADAQGALKQTEISAAYARNLNSLSASDISTWLCGLVRGLHAVTLRESGGIYFLLHAEVARWEKMVRAIRKASGHTMFSIPAMRGEDCMAAVIDAVQHEAAALADSMETELKEQDLGATALTTRQRKVQACAAKVGRYERFLGIALTELQGRLKLLNANLAEAALLASVKEE